MIKRFLFAVAPMMLVASSVMADDSLLSAIATMDMNKADAIAATAANVDNLGQSDVDALLAEGDEVSGEEAIAACFRRIGFGGYGGGFGGYGHHFGFRSWHNPCFTNFYSYPAIHCYRPVAHCFYTPVYTNYWGCW